jgi:hypothetical protein
MPILPFGPWEPDSSGVDARDDGGRVVLQVAKNVYPTKTGYGPVPSLSAITPNALSATETCVGLTFARQSSSGGYLLFAGTRTKLFMYASDTQTWTDVSRTSGGAYNVSTDDYWSFAQFGNQLIAVNFNDDPQVIDVNSPSHFVALGGSPPKARYVTVVGDFVVLGCLSTNERKVRNSAINDAAGWTVGTNLCDEQEFPDGGRVTGIAGGEFGWILQEKSIRKMDFHAGADIAFSFERVEREHGAAAGYSVVSTINAVFFLSDDGFYAFGANGLVPIGAQRINKWFQQNSDTVRFFSVVAFADPYAPRIAWAFFNAASSTTFDRLLIYDWQLDRWSYGEVSAQFWATSVTSGLTLEGLDIYGSIDPDGMGGGVPYSLDSRVWEGGRPVIGAIDTSGRLSFLEAPTPLDARLTTAPLRLNASARANVSAVEPVGVFNGASLAIRVGRRERTQEAIDYTAVIAPSERSGIARMKASGRFHEIETSITQGPGALWTHAQGLDVTATADGRK